MDPHNARHSIEVGHEVGFVHDHLAHDLGSQDLLAQDFARLAAVV